MIVDPKGQMRSVEQVTSVLMKRMKETAENNLGKEVSVGTREQGIMWNYCNYE
jgi:hypothetical protein